jgi:hypothetical protein
MLGPAAESTLPAATAEVWDKTAIMTTGSALSKRSS